MPTDDKPFETEAYGVLYERYAMGKLFESMTRKCGIKSVLEMPARGAKAMPSMYSHGFAEAGCDLTLVNSVEASRKLWSKLGYDDSIEYVECDNLLATDFDDASHDLVWNFHTFAPAEDPEALLAEMMRISRKYVLIVSVNRGNVGFPCHRMAHKFTGIPWTHGDIRYNSTGFVRKFMKSHGMKVADWGFVDCPVWPDSLGFRDIRLHRLGVDLDTVDWESEYFDYKAQGVPDWIKWVYRFESIPMPRFLKTFYSHLFYVLAEKPADGTDLTT